MKNKKPTAIQWGILIISLLFFALTFIPCIRMEYYSVWEMQTSVSYERYKPLLCGAFTFFELLLLFVSQRTWSGIVRIVFDLMKTFLPQVAVFISNSVGSLVTDAGYSGSFTGTVYIITALGILIAVLDLTDLFMNKKRSAVM